MKGVTSKLQNITHIQQMELISNGMFLFLSYKTKFNNYISCITSTFNVTEVILQCIHCMHTNAAVNMEVISIYIHFCHIME